MSFDLESIRRDLIAKRVAAGADSEIGHRCSNLIQQIGVYATTPARRTDLRANLAKAIQESHDDLTRLTRGE